MQECKSARISRISIGVQLRSLTGGFPYFFVKGLKFEGGCAIMLAFERRNEL